MEKDIKEVLKEVLALHGWGGYGYQNGLVERGQLYLETEDGKVKRYKNACDAEMMEEVDKKIKKLLE
jgi:hypothetical protein